MFTGGIGSALVAPVLPSATSAQQRVYRLAFVHSGIPADKLTESDGPFWVRRLYQALRQLGYVEGQNLIVARFSADGRSERFAPLADEVVSRKPDVIILNLNNLAKIFMVAISTIPLVAILSDPIATGLLTNLAHPGGNLTGVSINAGLEIYGKRLQIIKEAMPKVAKVAVLFSAALSGRSEYEEGPETRAGTTSGESSRRALSSSERYSRALRLANRTESEPISEPTRRLRQRAGNKSGRTAHR